MTTQEARQVLDWLDAGQLEIKLGTQDWCAYDPSKHASIWIPGDAFEMYRIKPPAPTLRPWRPEEVPVGCPIKCIGTGSVYLLTGTCCATPTKVMTSGGEHSLVDLSKTYFVSLDQGKTWLPCGVME